MKGASAEPHKYKTTMDYNYHDLLIYEPTTGHLIWKERPDGFMGMKSVKSWNTKHAGKSAGTFGKKNGIVTDISVRIFGKAYLAHRIIWHMHYGQPPKRRVIDHIDGDPTNNRLDNLRLATFGQNAQNTKPKKNSTYKLKGVSFELGRKKGWKAEIKKNGKSTTIGRFATMEEAHAAYREEASKLYGNYARFE